MRPLVLAALVALVDCTHCNGAAGYAAGPGAYSSVPAPTFADARL